MPASTSGPTEPKAPDLGSACGNAITPFPAGPERAPSPEWSVDRPSLPRTARRRYPGPRACGSRSAPARPPSAADGPSSPPSCPRAPPAASTSPAAPAGPRPGRSPPANRADRAAPPRAPGPPHVRQAERLDGLVEERGPPQQRLDQGDAQVRARDRQHQAGQAGPANRCRTTVDAVRDRLSPSSAQFTRCRSQSRGTSRGPIRPRTTPSVASRSAYRSACGSASENTPRAASGAEGVSRETSDVRFGPTLGGSTTT